MKPHRSLLLGTFAITALTLIAYRALPQRSFAADDFQWLLGAQRLSFGAMLRSAFDPSQSHFYRPIVWIAFWLQAHVFGLDPRWFHTVSLALHLANALLAGWLAWRVTTNNGQPTNSPTFVFRLSSFVLPAAFVALHPAPFEAVAWVSGQSELLAAFWLLLMVHCWLSASRLFVFRPLAFASLALALLTKESAIIGLPLLVLLSVGVRGEQGTQNHKAIEGHEGHEGRQKAKGKGQHNETDNGQRITNNKRYECTLSPHHLVTLSRHLVLPTLLTLAYIAVQLRVERANYIVDQGGYGIGPQLLLNPLRSLGLLVAPLPSTEHADAPWLIGVGALVALGLIVLLIRRRAVAGILALGLTLLPTAPFASPPDSRYLYLPVIAGAVLLAALTRHVVPTKASSHQGSVLFPGVLVPWWLKGTIVALALLATAELSAREQRFATATGADGSLFQVAAARCAAGPTDRVIVLNPPIAEIHARAILDLACGSTITPIFVDTMAVALDNLELHSLIIDFPGGSAQIARQM